MALFGAPIAHEDHARRACYAALRLSEELRQYADELRRTKGLNFSVRMGLNSGEVVVGKIGDDLRMDYTAQGHTVGLAARMEEIAAAGSGVPHGAHGEARRGLFPAGRSRPLQRQRRGGAAGGLRAAGGRAASHPAGGVGAARAGALCRPTRGDGAASPGVGGGAGRARADRRRSWARRASGSRGWSTSSRLPWSRGCSGAGSLLGLPRQGVCVPAAGRSPEELLRDHPRGRRAQEAGEDHREGPDAGPNARGHAAVPVLPAGDRGGDGVARADGPGDPAATDTGGRRSGCWCGRPSISPAC